MILLRGIKGEQFARAIDEGIIGFRDLLSTLLNTNFTGYTYSDYYEKYCVQAFKTFMSLPLNVDEFEKSDVNKLLLIFNKTIPYIYLTYFHILNENSIKDWLVHFEDDMHFIFIEPKIDEISNNLLGQNLMGRKMEYVTNINSIDSTEFILKSTGLLQFIQSDIRNVTDPGLAMQYASFIYNLMLPLFSREVGNKYKDIENEFRIIYKVSTIINTNTGELCPYEDRIFNIMFNSSRNYYGSVKVINDENDLKRCDMPLIARNIPTQPYKTSLIEEVRKKIPFTVQSNFKNIKINDFVNSYGYVGNKEECEKFVTQKLKE